MQFLCNLDTEDTQDVLKLMVEADNLQECDYDVEYMLDYLDWEDEDDVVRLHGELLPPNYFLAMSDSIGVFVGLKIGDVREEDIEQAKKMLNQDNCELNIVVFGKNDMAHINDDDHEELQAVLQLNCPSE